MRKHRHADTATFSFLRNLTVGGALLVCPLSGMSQTADTVAFHTRKIDELVVTSRKTGAKISSSTPYQSISETQIEHLGIQSMADAVRRFAGTNVKDYGGIGGLKTVSVRNLGAQHTAVSYDDTPVSNTQAGQIDIGRFSLDNVGMVSLAVGQADDMLQCARLYTSAAVLGIHTESPHFDNGRPFSLRARLRGGSFGYVSPSLRWWQKIGEKVTVTADADLIHADGNYPFILKNGKLTTREKRNNSAINSRHAEANIYLTLPKNSHLQGKAYYYYSKRGLPGAVTLYNPVSNEKLWDENCFAQIKYRKTFSRKWKLQALAKYDYGWNKIYDEGPQYASGIYSDTHRQNEYFISASTLYTPIQGVNISLAQDGIINTLRSTMTACPMPDRWTSLTAMAARFATDRVTLNGTLTNTFITESVKSGEKPSDIKHLNPSASVSFKVLSEKQFFVRAMYKNTFRVPAFNELYYFRVGTRSLKPEKANEFNLGLTWGHSLFSVMEYLNITADAYYNDVTDKIVAVPTTYVWKMTNYGKAKVTGLDVTLASAFSLPARMSLVVSGAYTWQNAIDVTDKDAKNYRGQLPYTPRHSGNGSVLLESPWVNVGYTLQGVGKRYFLAENIPANVIEGYVEQDLTFSRDLKTGTGKLSLTAEICNLANKQYDVIKYYPMPGRSWRVSASFLF